MFDTVNTLEVSQHTTTSPLPPLLELEIEEASHFYFPLEFITNHSQQQSVGWEGLMGDGWQPLCLLSVLGIKSDSMG